MPEEKEPYSDDEIRRQVHAALNDSKRPLHDRGVFRRKGRTSDTREPMRDVATAVLLEDGKLDAWLTKFVTQDKCPKHQGPLSQEDVSEAHDSEALLADRLLKYCKTDTGGQRRKLAHLGWVAEREVPLAAKRGTKIGKVDLISFTQQDGDSSVYLIELKKRDSTEEILRAALQIVLYERLIELQLKKYMARWVELGWTTPDARIRKAILVGLSSGAGKNLADLAVAEASSGDGGSAILHLLDRYKIDVFGHDHARQSESYEIQVIRRARCDK